MLNFEKGKGKIGNLKINPLTHGVYQKVTHTKTKQQVYLGLRDLSVDNRH